MQPGPPYPPQQPPTGPQPYPGQPYPGQPYPGQQASAPMGQPQPGYPQQPGYPPPGYQQGYPAPRSGGPRKSRTGLIVGIVIAVVVVLGGGGATAFFLLRNSGHGDQRIGRYTTEPACSKLDAPPYRFTAASPATSDSVLDSIGEDCTANLGDDPSGVSASVNLSTFLGPGGIGVAQRSLTSLGTPLSGHGFENPVDVSYQSDTNGRRCNFQYYRSNELIRITFYAMTGVHDQASCLSTGLPIVTTLYRQIG
jgi:hypothetical protein